MPTKAKQHHTAWEHPETLTYVFPLAQSNIVAGFTGYGATFKASVIRSGDVKACGEVQAILTPLYCDA